MSDKWNLTIGSSQGKKFVNLYLNNQRFRYWNGKTIGLNLKSSDNAQLLRSAFELKLIEGWRPEPKKKVKEETKPNTLLLEIEVKLNNLLKGNYSYHHKRDCKWVFSELVKFLANHNLSKIQSNKISVEVLTEFISQNKWSNRTHKNVLTTLKCIAPKAIQEPLATIKTGRTKSTLHKPIQDISRLLNDIKQYNENLYLTCILTYGCLLRPHQEIRLLKWSDIDLKKGIISLSGSRNKSGRNRIVPIPSLIRTELNSRVAHPNDYLLSNNGKAYSKDYLSVLWKRFKAQSKLDLDYITLYSFRHSGAIQVFEKTGSLQKLQQVMGHSDMQVSLTYLRGLEISHISEKDLPQI
ncbi:tyrosine-type recombinase/integrase [Schleiferiaceae bacterium]|nr:tyrosine-type recombinase/integrase [Schleiferiaceae bacterium]